MNELTKIYLSVKTLTNVIKLSYYIASLSKKGYVEPMFEYGDKVYTVGKGDKGMYIRIDYIDIYLDDAESVFTHISDVYITATKLFDMYIAPMLDGFEEAKKTLSPYIVNENIK